MAGIRQRELLGLLIGNMFELGLPLVRAENGPRGGDKGYIVGNVSIPTKRVRWLRQNGWLNGDKPTEKAILWYQNSLQDE